MVAKPDEVKQIATQAVTAGVMRVIATVVDPQAAAKKLVDDVKELPKKAAGKAAELPLKALGQAMELQSQVGDLPKIAAGLPLKIALQAVATGEKVRSLLPGHGAAAGSDGASTPPVVAKGAAKPASTGGAAAWDAAAPKPAPEDYTPPLAGAHTAQAATVRAELKAVPGTTPTATKAVKAAAKKAAAAPSPAAPSPAVSEPVVPAAAAATAKAVKAVKATAKRAPAKAVPAKAAPAKAAPAKAAPAKAAAKAPASTTAKAPAEAPPAAPTPAPTPPAAPETAAATQPLATVTPIHSGRDGHVDTPLPVTVEAAVEAAVDGATLSSGDLPLADYDSLSITQIRSRISKLDAVALVQLRDYERAHADRTPIVTLLETKLAKVTATTIDTASRVSSSAPGETATLIAEAPSKN